MYEYFRKTDPYYDPYDVDFVEDYKILAQRRTDGIKNPILKYMAEEFDKGRK